MKDKYKHDYEYLLLNNIVNKINEINIENMELKYQLRKYGELYSYNSAFCDDYCYFENRYRINIEIKNNMKSLYKSMKNKDYINDIKNRDSINYIYL